MSTFTSEPGTRLGGRYRLEDRINSGAGWSAWKAIDETLARPVTVLTFAPGFPCIAEVVTAARAASRLTDARLAQVFDVEEDWDQAYIVMEWVAGESLHDLLADGPLDPGLSTELIAQCADALASAHAAGLAHLCLTPGSLRWTAGGGVKVIGLGIDAALSGTTADDPALADTSGLGKLLYAALTAHWPGDEWPALPPAPLAPDGRPCSPRQVVAGIPGAVDDITCQALFGGGYTNGQPMATPATLADALARLVPAPTAPPPAPPHLRGEPGWDDGPGWDDTPSPVEGGEPYWQLDTKPPRRPARSGRRGISRRRGPAPLLGATLVLVLVLAAAGLWVLSQRGTTAHGGGKPSHSPTSTAAPVGVLTPASAHGFDAYSGPADDAQNENDQLAKYAIDGNPATAWHTQYYFNNPVFGGLKKGTGLILDMSKPVKLASVQITFGPVPGADVQIMVGNDNTRAAATLSTFTTVASLSNVSGQVTFTSHGNARGRYVLIWFTKLPPKAAGSSKRFEAQISSIVVRGSS